MRDELYDDVEDLFYNEMLPHALLFGMTPKQFWEDDPQLFWVYGKKYEIETKEKYKMLSYEGWVNNQYTGLILSIAFGKGGQKYPATPFGFEEENVDKGKTLENKILATMSKAMSDFDRLHPTTNATMEKGDASK